MTLDERIAAFENDHPDWGWDVGVMKNGRYNAIVWPKDRANKTKGIGEGGTPLLALKHAIAAANFEKEIQ